MFNKRLFSISMVFILTLLLVFGGLLNVDVLANDEDKIIGEYANDGNLPGYILELESYKFEPIATGTTTENGITIDVNQDGQLFNWESNRYIAYVFVKGGSSGYLYDYTPGSFSGVGLHSPENPNGEYAGLSHITFYFAEVGSLEVSKEFLYNGQLVSANDIDADFNFEVTVTGPLGYSVTQSGIGNQTLLFDELVAGIYTVTETSSGTEWQVDVATQDAAVVSGGLAEVTIINNYMIIAETAWVAHDVGEYRYTSRGNWATYVVYDELDSGGANIYAGQDNYAGYVEFIKNGNNVEIQIELEGWAFEPDTTNLYVQDYNKEPKGNHSPGRFDYKKTSSGYSASITVPFNKYYGVHLNVYEIK